jgi:hypothetical protein
MPMNHRRRCILLYQPLHLMAKKLSKILAAPASLGSPDSTKVASPVQHQLAQINDAARSTNLSSHLYG